MVSSIARRIFEANSADVRDFYSIHQLTKDQRAVLRKLPVLNKSMVVLITAMWEAYCEDLATEALHLIVVNARSPDRLPVYLRKVIAREVREERHELAPWRLAGEGWREMLVRRLAALQQDRERNLNNPSSEKVDDFFLEALGITHISQYWSWPGTSAADATHQLDEYVNLRHQIAHRARLSRETPKKVPKDYINLVKRLVPCTEHSVEEVVARSIGESPWRTSTTQEQGTANQPPAPPANPA